MTITMFDLKRELQAKQTPLRGLKAFTKGPSLLLKYVPLGAGKVKGGGRGGCFHDLSGASFPIFVYEAKPKHCGIIIQAPHKLATSNIVAPT